MFLHSLAVGHPPSSSPSFQNQLAVNFRWWARGFRSRDGHHVAHSAPPLPHQILHAPVCDLVTLSLPQQEYSLMAGSKQSCQLSSLLQIFSNIVKYPALDNLHQLSVPGEEVEEIQKFTTSTYQ